MSAEVKACLSLHIYTVHTVLCITQKEGCQQHKELGLKRDRSKVREKNRVQDLFVKVTDVCLLTIAFNDCLYTQLWLRQKSAGCCKVKPTKQRIIKMTRPYFGSNIYKGTRKIPQFYT